MWYGGPWGYGMMGSYGGWGMGIGWLLMIIVWIAIVVFLFILVRHLVGGHHGDFRPGRRALDILDERYARGEIDQDEYKRRRADLGF